MKRQPSLLYLVAILLFYTHQLSAQSPFCFTSASDNMIRTGSQSKSIAVRDFNGDAIPDIIVTNTKSNTISLVPGDGDRNFRAPEIVAEISQPFMIMSEDFNNDGNFDLAVSALEGPLSIFLGDGNGSFVAKETYPGFELATILKSADFNKDGKADIVGYSPTNSSLSIIFGDGTGKFGSTKLLWESNYIIAIGLADFTGDNNIDIAFSDAENLKFHILKNDGTGVFADQVITDSPAGNFVNADFNGDNKQDLFFDGVKLLYGDGTGSFPTNINVPQIFADASMVAGDFNGDEILDVASVDSFGPVRILYGVSHTSFQSELVIYNAGNSPAQIIAQDMDDDGRPDFVFAEYDEVGGVLVLYNDIDSYSSTEGYQLMIDGFGMFVADLNNDGKKDIISAEATYDRISVLLQNNNGFQKVITPGMNITFGAKAVGDYNGDGKIDLASNSIFNGDVMLFYGAGNGTFTNGPTFSYNTGDLTGADFNNDGDADLAVTLNSTNFIGVMLSNGAGSFTKVDYNAGIFPTDVRTGDFNNDGKLDIVCSTEGDSKVIVFFGNGNGSFGTANTFVTNTTIQPAIYSIDLNGDKKNDLITTDPEVINGFEVLINTGGSFVSTAKIEFDQWVNALTYADYDGDGFVDIAVGGRNERNLFIYQGNGDGTFGTPILFASGSIDELVTADLNNDGTEEIVVGRTFSGLITILRNNTARIKPSGSVINCVGNVTLKAGDNGFTYQWSTPEGPAYGQTITTDVRGTYSLIVSNASQQCKSTADVTIEGKPALPSASIINTTCTETTGSLIIEKQVNNDVYSFDNGVNFQVSNIKTGLTPGEYKVVIKSADGCKSKVAIATIDPQPTPPTIPVVESSDPTCAVHAGTVIVTIQKEGDTYSFDNGQTFMGVNRNDNLAPGDYKILIRRALDCVSDTTDVTINHGPEIPSKPFITMLTTADPAPFLSSLASGYEWSKDGFPIDGATEQQYAPTSTGTYTVVVFSVDGCRSEPSDGISTVINGDIDELVSGFYPNPTDSYIHYQTTEASVSSMIFTSSGKQISIVPAQTAGELIYDVRDFTPGVYVLKLTAGTAVKTIRWVKR